MKRTLKYAVASTAYSSNFLERNVYANTCWQCFEDSPKKLLHHLLKETERSDKENCQDVKYGGNRYSSTVVMKDFY